MIACLSSSYKAQTLDNNLAILNPHIHDLVFQLCTLFDPTLDSPNMSMTMVLHLTIHLCFCILR
jgi:hypothetical protein